MSISVRFYCLLLYGCIVFVIFRNLNTICVLKLYFFVTVCSLLMYIRCLYNKQFTHSVTLTSAVSKLTNCNGWLVSQFDEGNNGRRPRQKFVFGVLQL